MPDVTLRRDPTVPRRGVQPRPTGWALAALVCAGAAAYDPWGFVPSGPLRWTVVTVTTLLAAATLAGRAVEVRRASALAWLALLGWMLVATLAAVDPLHAWIGTPDRRLGWLAWVTFATALGCGQALAGKGQVRLVVRACALAAGLLGACALAEAAGVLPGAREFAGGRLGGAYGQPAYLGAAAALLVPVAAGLAAEASETWRWRVVSTLGAGLGMVALLASQTRGAWVGFVVGAALVARRVVAAARAHRLAAALAAAALMALAVATGAGGRAASLTGEAVGGGTGRVDEWRVAAVALAGRPLLGAGPEGYRVVFPSAVDAAYTRAHGRDVVVDRAHNGVLDAGLSGGVPALGAYLVLLGLAVRDAWRVRRAAPWLAGVGASVAAYAVQQQFLFPLAEIDPVFWVLAGLLAGGAPAIAAAQGGRTRRPAVWSVRVPAAAGAVLAALAVAALVAGGLEVAADRDLQRAAAATGAFDRSDALGAADRATALRPDSVRAWFVAARVAARGEAITAVDDALDRIEAGLARSSRDPALRAEHAALLLERAQRSLLPSDLRAAREALDRLVTDDPHHPGHRLRLAAALELAGDDAGATGHRCAASELLTSEPRTSPRAPAC